MRPFAEEIFTGYQSPLCEGPVSESFSWGGVFSSVNCASGSGAVFNSLGYEIGNSATPFAVTGKKFQAEACNPNDTVVGFKGGRGRAVGCTSAVGVQGSDFSQTSGGTPGLCNLGISHPHRPQAGVRHLQIFRPGRQSHRPANGRQAPGRARLRRERALSPSLRARLQQPRLHEGRPAVAAQLLGAHREPRLRHRAGGGRAPPERAGVSVHAGRS
jgi:hypothetical protein